VLKGLPDAIGEVWPLAVTQTCVIHLLRASCRYAGRQHWDAIARALRPVYTAPTEAAALKCVYLGDGVPENAGAVQSAAG
jgi:putative transposase